VITTQLSMWMALIVAILMAGIVIATWLIKKKYRLSYIATICCILIVALATLWIRNRAASEHVSLSFIDKTPTTIRGWALSFGSTNGALDVAFSEDVNNVARTFKDKFNRFEWGRLPPDPQRAWKYPEYSSLPLVKPIVHFKWQRFEAATFSQSEQPDRVVRTRFAGIIVPQWFPILLLLIPIAMWFYQSRWGIYKYRRKHNLCEKCEYSLQGLPSPVRCPECGTQAHWKTGDSPASTP